MDRQGIRVHDMDAERGILMSFLELLPTLNPWWQSQGARSARELPRRRTVCGTLLDRLRHPTPDRRAVVLLGPRQAGKTTALLQAIDTLLDEGWPPGNLLYHDFFDSRGAPAPPLDAVDSFEPPGFRRDLPRIWFFDEVTRAPGWAASLKRMVDDARRAPAARSAYYVVSDSAAGLLRTGLADVLEGRTDDLRISGLLYSEFLALLSRDGETTATTAQRLPGAFERYVSLGGFPGLHRYEDHALARRILREDIAEKAIRRDLDRENVDIPRVCDLFSYLVRDSGSIFVAAERSRDLSAGERGIDERTVRSWVGLLEQCCLLARLESWSPLDRRHKASSQLAARPKLYAEDHGLVAAFDPRPDPLAREGVRDRVLETLVYTHLRGLQRRKQNLRITYFRDKLGEIDFLLDGVERPLAIEVTSSSQPAKHVAKTARAVQRTGLDRVVILHEGGDTGERDGIRLVRIEDFLLDLDSFMEGL